MRISGTQTVILAGLVVLMMLHTNIASKFTALNALAFTGNNPMATGSKK